MAFPGPKIVGGLLALSISATACSSGPASRATTTTSADRTATTAADPTVEILAAYLGFWDAVFVSLSPPNPDHPALAEFATGGQLDRSRDVAAEDQTAGIATRRGDPPTDHAPRVAERAGNAAVVVDCYLDTNVLYRVESGEVVGDRQVLTSVEARLVRVDGRWKVERTAIRVLEEEESCDAPAPSPR